MYGLVNVSIRDMVIEGYGVKTWARYTACWRIPRRGMDRLVPQARPLRWLRYPKSRSSSNLTKTNSVSGAMPV